MNNIQIDYEGQNVNINLTSIEAVIALIIQMGKDFVQWLVSVYQTTKGAQPLLRAV